MNPEVSFSDPTAGTYSSFAGSSSSMGTAGSTDVAAGSTDAAETAAGLTDVAAGSDALPPLRTSTDDVSSPPPPANVPFSRPFTPAPIPASSSQRLTPPLSDVSPRPSVVMSVASTRGPIVSERPRPKRLRPAELNNLEMYQDQETIRISRPVRGVSSSSSQTTEHSSTTFARHNSSSSNRYSSLKNMRNVTTGRLALGEMPIIISPDLVDRFMEISTPNSYNKIETGGLLAGVIEESVRFKVTTLLIPKQNGRSDYWEAEDEAGIQAFFFKKELLLLGCIHTHPPPWTSFLSSIDLYQLFDFQKDNPSAVSVVVAPAHMPTHVPAYAYSLTDLGLTVLADCKRAGVHQHRERSRAGHELYGRAGHLTWKSDLTIKTVDLRI